MTFNKWKKAKATFSSEAYIFADAQAEDDEYQSFRSLAFFENSERFHLIRNDPSST